jgi:hypothetical protein
MAWPEFITRPPGRPAGFSGNIVSTASGRVRTTEGRASSIIRAVTVLSSRVAKDHDAAGMLFAHLQLRAPEARSILLAPPRSGQLTASIGPALSELAHSAGHEVRLVDVANHDARASKAAQLDQAVLWNRDNLRMALDGFTGLTIVMGQGILDSPQTVLAAGTVDAVILVARAGKTDRSDLAAAGHEVERAGGRLLGAVLYQ